MYFPIRVSFRVSEGKNGEIRIAFLSYLFLCGYYTPYSRSLLFSYAVFFCCVSLLFFSLRYVLVLYLVVTAVFFADLPILLPSVWLSPLLCIIVRLGVFRGSEAKKLRFCVVVGLYIYGKRADETFLVSHPPYVFGWLCLLCHFLCRNDVVLSLGSIVLTFPITVGVMLS